MLKSAKKNWMGSDGVGGGVTLDRVVWEVLFEKVKFEVNLENLPAL